MMKVYGAEICMDCRNYKAIQKTRGFEAEYIDITENRELYMRIGCEAKSHTHAPQKLIYNTSL